MFPGAIFTNRLKSVLGLNLTLKLVTLVPDFFIPELSSDSFNLPV